MKGNPTAFLFLIQCIIAIFVILNPFGNIPLVLSFTSGSDRSRRNHVILRSSITALIILFIFALIGQFLFNLFHITIGAFRIAGGILLFTISLSMLYGERSKAKITSDEVAEATTKEDVAVTPLGIPLMAGPGAIATVISLMDQAHHWWPDKILVLFSIPLAVIVGYYVLRLGSPIMTLVGESGLRVTTRIMGLILAVIAVQFVINGVHDALPQILHR